MINLENEKIVREIKDLIDTIDYAKAEIDIYCDLMKQIFLSASSEN